MFCRIFLFIDNYPHIEEMLIDYLFAFFFLALMTMMFISNAIISYTSFYRNAESHFLLSVPTRIENIFLYKAVESVLFSAWGMLIMVMPLLVAYGTTRDAPTMYYPYALLVSILFMILPMEAGAITALIIPFILPKKRGLLAKTALAVGMLFLGVWIVSLLRQRPSRLFSEAGLQFIVDRIAFSQHWALPSRWISEGILAAASDNFERAGTLSLVLLANILFIGMIAIRIAKSLFLKSWGKAHAGGGETRKINPANFADRILAKALSPLPPQMRMIIIKDFKSFRRDPVQWSQFLLFFGLLALYIVNLPRLGFARIAPYWQSLISLLNLGATCLTLATLTSRFIFPQLSLEGRRIWITGMAPMPRHHVLWAKFLFSTASSIIISATLITLSDLLLGIPLWTLGIHLLVVICGCSGLNGMATGLGAIYPNMHSDNPSQIVSGFGGTLNLICSVFYIIITILLVAIPTHLHATGMLMGGDFQRWLTLNLILGILIATIVTLVPMLKGQSAFQKMEF
jgi:ABC-2 type transport system permease protein